MRISGTKVVAPEKEASSPLVDGSDIHSTAGNQQELLQAYIQLQERYRRCTDALAAAAHDLKTPLSILSGYIELLEDEKLGELSDKQRPVVRDMRISSARL